jgi:hypothetical protein
MDIDELKHRAGITEATSFSETDKFIQLMHIEMDRLQTVLDKQRPMSYQDTGIGRRQYDQAAVTNIDQIEKQIEGLDLAIDALMKAKQPESPRNW